MRSSFGRPSSAPPRLEPLVYTDDGGSGLLKACKRRFAPPDYVVGCDVRHTVWVKRADGTRSFGLSPWLLGRQSMDELLEQLETRLALPVTQH